MILYSLRTADGDYLITKFDDDLNIVPDSQYLVSLTSCTCPAGTRPTCRHRQMLPHFLATERADSDWFFCFDDGSWHQPFEALEVEGTDDQNEVEAEGAAPPIDDLPEGVTVIGLDDPEVLHNTIAASVGEAPATTSPASVAGVRRRF